MNTNFEEIQSLFNITQKLMLEHSEEILNVHTIESTSPSWARSGLSHDQVIQWTTAKVRVQSGSAPCLGKMNDSIDAISRWEGQVEEIKMSLSYKELLRIDGEPIEFEWNSEIFSKDFRHCRFFRKSMMICETGTLNLRNSETGSSSCECSTTSIGQEKRIRWNVYSEFRKSQGIREKILQRHWTFLGLGDEKKWCGTLLNTLEGK